MKVVLLVVLLNGSLLQACLEKIPTVQIQNYDGPIYLVPPKHSYEPILHQNKCDIDCTCLTKVPKYCEYNYCEVPKVCDSFYGNYPNYYETKVCNVPKVCEGPKVHTIPNYYEVPKVCTTPNYCTDSKFDISKCYDQYYQQQKCFLSREGCQKLGFLTEAKVKIDVIPEGYSYDDPRTFYGYKCDDGGYNYGSQGCIKTCLCKKCGGYITI